MYEIEYTADRTLRRQAWQLHFPQSVPDRGK